MERTSSIHSHVFLGAGHERSERKTWAVIWLCGIMMAAEMIGGALFGSVALIADGLHMSTHAGALLIAALAYTYARRHATDPRFAFGTGKLGDLAGFTSAIILAVIALLIGYEAVSRLFSPVDIAFRQAIPVAVVGLMVNLASAWLLGGGEGHHGHRHARPAPGAPQEAAFVDHDHDHPDAGGKTHRDNNMRAAFIHVAADAAVSVLVIVGLSAAWLLGWRWMDPVVGMIGALVVASWSFGLIRDTGAVLLDMNPDRDLADNLRQAVEADGDRLADLHLWRLGPGHLGAIVSIVTARSCNTDFYRAKLGALPSLSHLTIEIHQQ
jgi:cation diffusion facilitator family transporter